MITLRNISRLLIGASTVSVLALGSASAGALNATTAAVKTDATQARIQNIISKGDQEITRRLTSLNKLSGKISGAQKLSDSSKSSLTTEVSNEITGLTALKTKLDAETTLDGAKADAQSIFSDYRVYALIMPKVHLVRLADDEQVTAGKLSDIATKLQARIDSAKSSGKDVATLTTQMAQLQQLIQTVQSTASSVETKVLALEPSDYNSDHSVLSGYSQQLAATHQQNQQAYQLAKTMVGELKSL